MQRIRQPRQRYFGTGHAAAYPNVWSRGGGWLLCCVPPPAEPAALWGVAGFACAGIWCGDIDAGLRFSARVRDQLRCRGLP